MTASLIHQIENIHCQIGEAFAAGEPVLGTRLESKLFDLCIIAGMDMEEPDHLEWSAGFCADARAFA